MEQRSSDQVNKDSCKCKSVTNCTHDGVTQLSHRHLRIQFEYPSRFDLTGNCLEDIEVLVELPVNSLEYLNYFECIIFSFTEVFSSLFKLRDGATNFTIYLICILDRFFTMAVVCPASNS
ncbi:hypothetical protein D3C85_1373650 [compost metagenome]